MPFVAAAARVVRAAPEACFAAFAHFPSWKDWMPASFRPVWGPKGALSRGDRMLIRLASIPVPALIDIVRVEPGRAVVWRGGVPGVMTGEHAFYFDASGDGGTNVRSEETWAGVLADVGPIRRGVKVVAERVGGEQLAAFAGWMEGRRRG